MCPSMKQWNLLPVILTEPNLTNLLTDIRLFLFDGGCCVVELRLLLLGRKANSLRGELRCASSTYKLFYIINVTQIAVSLSYTRIYFENNNNNYDFL